MGITHGTVQTSQKLYYSNRLLNTTQNDWFDSISVSLGQVLSSEHGDFYRAIAGGKSASNQIEFMKKYGSSNPILNDVRTNACIHVFGTMESSSVPFYFDLISVASIVPALSPEENM